MAGLLKTPSLHLTPTLLHAPSVPFKPFCVSFAGGRKTSASLSRRASLRFFSGGQALRLLNFVPFASGEAETTETEVEATEPEIQAFAGRNGAVRNKKGKNTEMPYAYVAVMIQRAF